MAVTYYNRGKLEVIAGPMFAGKSSELLKRLLFIEHGGYKVLVLKPVVDNRYGSGDEIVTHNKLRHPAVSVIDLELVKDNYTIKPYNFHTVFIDEAQFFDTNETVWFVEEGLRSGVNFVVAGLDQDSRGVPFETTARMLALADEVLKIKAFCTVCGMDAGKTQRLRETSQDDRVKVGGAETYEPRCHEHWESK
jgi:thymidine kinase|tara:strand:+ start:4497 stop:5075 length:579 start_codon:yes stop_codon:yes gene_type:complete